MTILVLGATGLQGGAVARVLLARGMTVRGLTRTPDSPAATTLAGEGAEIVAGDLNRPETLDAAFKGAAAVYSVQDFYAPGVGLAGEIRQARNTFEAARRASAFVVQSGMALVPDPAMPAHFLSKAVIARELAASGLPHAILGTVWFLENLLVPARAPKLHFPVHAGMLGENVPFHMLSVRDLGEVAAQALTEPASWEDRRLDLAGDVRDVAGMRAAWRRATGRREKRWRFPRTVFRRVAAEYADQLDWHRRAGFTHDTSATTAALRRPPIGFESFVKEKQLAGL